MDNLNHFKHRAYVWMATLTISKTGPTCGLTPKTFSGTRPTCRRTSKTISRTRLTRRHSTQTPHAIFFFYMQLNSLSNAKIIIQNIKCHFCSQETVGELHEHYLKPHDRPSPNITTQPLMFRTNAAHHCYPLLPLLA